METAVCPLRRAFAGKLPLRVLLCPLEREYPGGVGKIPRYVLEHCPAEDFSPVCEIGDADLRNPGPGQSGGVEVAPDFLVPDFCDQLVLAIGLLQFRPTCKDFFRLFMEFLFKAGDLPAQFFHGQTVSDYLTRPGKLEEAPGDPGLLLHLATIGAHGMNYFPEVVDPVGGYYVLFQALPLSDRQLRQPAGPFFPVDGFDQPEVEAIGAGVVELGGDGAEYRQLLVRSVKLTPVAPVLLPDALQGVFRPFSLELVDRHQVRKIEHVDFFQLGRGAELTGHDIEGDIADADYAGITLPDAAGLDDHQVEPCGPHHVYGILNSGGQFCMGIASGKGTHIYPAAVDGVHPDPVAEQRPAGPLPGGINRQDGDTLVGKIEDEAAHQFIGNGTLAGAAR